MDRIAASKEKGKEYVQPQYIVDCLNNLFLLPTKPYLPGQPAPPHLSPFVDNEAQAYIPDRQREINALAGVETAVINAEESSEEEEEEPEAKKPQSDVESDNSEDEGASSDSESSDEPMPEVSAAQKAKKEAKLKADLEKEQQDMGKMLMTQRQRKLYQKAEESRQEKQKAAKKLQEKKKAIAKKR